MTCCTLVRPIKNERLLCRGPFAVRFPVNNYYNAAPVHHPGVVTSVWLTIYPLLSCDLTHWFTVRAPIHSIFGDSRKNNNNKNCCAETTGILKD